MRSSFKIAAAVVVATALPSLAVPIILPDFDSHLPCVVVPNAPACSGKVPSGILNSFATPTPTQAPAPVTPLPEPSAIGPFRLPHNNIKGAAVNETPSRRDIESGLAVDNLHIPCVAIPDAPNCRGKVSPPSGFVGSGSPTPSQALPPIPIQSLIQSTQESVLALRV